MKKLMLFFVALLTLVAATPASAKRSIMELPLFERAVLIIKHFETLHKPCHWPYVGYGIKSSRESHTAEAYNSPRNRPTLSYAKTSASSAPCIPNTARIPFFSAH